MLSRITIQCFDALPRQKWSRSNARSGSFSIRNQPLQRYSVNNSLTEKIFMTTQKQIFNSNSPSLARDRGPYSAHYAVNDGYRGWILLLIILVALGGAALVFAQNAAAKAKPKTQYHVSDLASLGGTSSGGNSINDQSWVAGYSRLLDRNRHATLWRNTSLTDLGTLGGPNSSVT